MIRADIMARKKRSESPDGGSSESSGGNEKVSAGTEAPDFSMGAMELMKEWYEQSGKMMNFLLNSFGNPGNPGNPGTGDEGAQ